MLPGGDADLALRGWGLWWVFYERQQAGAVREGTF